MINFDTNIKNNSLLDNRDFNIDGSFDADQIILNALNSKIDKRKRILDESKTGIECQFEDDYQEVPKYRDIIGLSKKSYFGLTQHWIGIVESIDKDHFIAKLEDKTNDGTYEIASFETSEVSPSDRELLSNGAIFYWSVGFASDNGQIEKRSLLRFKRSVGFTEEDINEIAEKSEHFNNSINWE